MKILHVIPSISQLRGGTSRAVIDMVRALNAYDNVDISVITTNDHGADVLPVQLETWVEYQGITVFFFPRFSPKVAPIREFAFSYPLIRWLWKHIKNYDLMHVHALFSYPSTIAMRIAHIQSVPYILMPHGLLCHWSLSQSRAKKKLFLGLIEHKNIINSAALHLTSKLEKYEVSETFPEVPSFILPLGLGMPKTVERAKYIVHEKFNIPLQTPVLLFLSRIHQKKGIEYLIHALKSINPSNYVLLIAGVGEEKYVNTLKMLIKSCNLDDKIQFVGFVSGQDKQILLSGSDLFVLTSHSENFCVSALEALASGLPCLLTPGVALSSVVQEHDFGFIPSLTVEDIAKSLRLALNDLEELASMGIRARQFIQSHYSWPQIASQIIDIYKINSIQHGTK